MKKLTLILILFTAFTSINAQQNKLMNAFSYYRNGQLDKAKEAIEECILNEKTSTQAKTWFYRGNIYLGIAISKEEKYLNLDSNAVQKAYDSYNKAIEFDKEISNEMISPQSPMIGLYVCSEQFYNKGVDLYSKGKYKDAMESFDRTIKINETFGMKDSSATYNAALSAELAEEWDKAKKYFQKLVKINYSQPAIYISLSNIYIKNEKDTLKALNTIKKARTLFPNNYNIIIAETNIYLSQGNITEAQKNLTTAVEIDPKNPMIHFAVGANYDQMGRIEDAEKAYMKAIELKPDYFDAVYNMGALFFNEGVKVFENADKITDNNLYAKEKEKFEFMWKKAQPYLEKALQLDPKDRNTLISLKQLYARTGQTDKLKEINDKISNLK